MRTITRQQVKAKLDAGEDIKLVMTVGGWTFRAGHIPGSLGFPSPRCALRELRRDDEIVVYSTNQHRQGPVAACQALEAHGYHNVSWYSGGLADWKRRAIPWRVAAFTWPPCTAGHMDTASVVKSPHGRGRPPGR